MLTKMTMVACSIAATFIGNATALDTEMAPAPAVSAQMRPPIGNMDDLLKMIQTLPEVKGFTEADYTRRTQGLTVAPDVKSFPDGPGFGLTVPRMAPSHQVDRCTLGSILNLQQGLEPVGFTHFWKTYADDASKLGYEQIKESFSVLEAMKYSIDWDCNLSKLDGSVPRGLQLKTMSMIEISQFLKITDDQAKNVMAIVSALPNIGNVATTMGELKALSTMSVDEARTWYDTQYGEKSNKYTQEYGKHQRVVQEFIRKYGVSGQPS